MATRAYFTVYTHGSPGAHRGWVTTSRAGVGAMGCQVHGLMPTNGTSAQSQLTTSVATSTPGIELGLSANSFMEFISLPIDRDITLTQNVTFNFWARQYLDCNCTLNFQVTKIDVAGDESTGIQVCSPTFATVEPTVHPTVTAALSHSTMITNLSYAMKKGERFRVVVWWDDTASTMVAGQTMGVHYSGPSGLQGDSWLEFGDTFGWLTTRPTGSVWYLTDSDSGSVPVATVPYAKEMWTSRGTGVVTATRAAQSGWGKYRFEKFAGGTYFIEWYSKRLNAFTLDGLVELSLPVRSSGTNGNMSIRGELAICDNDGSNVVEWGAVNLINTATPGGAAGDGYGMTTNVETVFKGWIAGAARAVGQGKRLRLRVVSTPSAGGGVGGGAQNQTPTFYYNGIDATTGDAWIQLPQTVTTSGGPFEGWATSSTEWNTVDGVSAWAGYPQAEAKARRTSAPSAMASVTISGASISTNWSDRTERMLSDTPPVSTMAPGDYSYGVGFTPQLNGGFITHIRYYNQSLGTHKLCLWQVTGQVKLSVATDIADTIGWREIALPTPVAVSTTWSYKVSYSTDGAAASLTSNPVVSLSTVLSDNNAWSGTGAEGYPVQSDLGNNYHVDVLWAKPPVWAATGVVSFPVPATISTNWGTWTAVASASVIEHPATSTSTWGTWTTAAAATVGRSATVAVNWGTWTGTAAAVVGRAATSTQSWGTWTGTATGIVYINRVATILSPWGTWVSAVSAITGRAAAISMTWGTWSSSVSAVVTRVATISSSWGTWTGIATGVAAPPFIPAVVTSNWGGWTATSSARRTSEWSTASAARTQPSYSMVTAAITSNWGLWVGTAAGTVYINRPATISDNWGSLAVSVSATVGRAAAISTNWGTWTATGAIPFLEHAAVIATNWGTWTAIAGPIDDRPATSTQSWGTWTATAAAGVAHTASIATPWGTWTAAATAQPPEHPATITSAWGVWTATAVAGVFHPATIVTTWGWTATAAAGVEHIASITNNWGTWTSAVSALHQVYAGINTTWLPWVGVATASVNAKISDNWGSWIATASATTLSAANINTTWSGWTATSTATRETFATATSSGTSTWSAAAVVGRSASIDTVWNTSGPSFSPDDIPGLALWLEADQLPTGALASWPNPGTAVDAPMVGSPNPVVVDGVTPSGQKVVRFKTSEGRVRMSGTSGVLADFTLVYVARMTPGAANWIGRIVNGIYSPANILFGYWNGYEEVAYDNGFAAPNTQTAVTSNWHLYSADGAPGLDRFFSDGVERGVIPTAQGWYGTFALNGYDPTTTAETCDFDIAGVLLYDNKLADLVRVQAEDYMRAKYLGAGLPTGGDAWTATATATVAHTSTITSPWGTWTATAVADPILHTASINSNWGTWNATAIGSQEGQAVAFIATVWPAWTASATAQPILHYGTIASTWAWTSTVSAGVNHLATSITNWSDGAQLVELFGGGADGVVMTTTNTVFSFLSGTPEFDTAVTYKTPQSMRLTNDATARYGRRDSLNSSACAFSVYVYFGSVAPAGNLAFIRLTDSAGANICAFMLNTAGRIAVADTTGASIATPPTNIASHAVTAFNWYRIDGLVNVGAGTGRVQYRICNVHAGDNNMPITTSYDSGTTASLGAANIGRCYVGAAFAGARNGEWNLSIFRYDDKRTTFFDAYQGWTAVATADPIQRNATVTSPWGTWTATASASVDRPATVSTNWGTWTASASATIVAEEVFATITSSWGAWIGLATGGIVKEALATVTSNWGTWAATSTGSLSRTATITSPWGTWTATAIAQPILHPASISTTYTTWTASASATVSHSASTSTTWTWSATATAGRETQATITSSFSATFDATAIVGHTAVAGYANYGRWTATAEGIAAPRGTTLNEADMVYLGDEAVDRIYLDDVIVWELV